MKFRLRAPATSANLGPGFDALGVALDLWNELDVEVLPGDGPVRLQLEGEGAATLPNDETNLVVQVARRYLRERGMARWPRLQLACLNRIPLARGLGSSAATRALGVMLGQMLADQGVNLEELCDQAARDEGSADNVAACTHGGLVSALAEGPRVRVLRCSVHPCWKVVVAIPPFPLETERSRQVLPQQVALQDAVFNAAHLPWLLQGLATGQGELVALGCQDRLHQSYRQGLIPGMGSVFQGAVRAGASACYLSGAGSTLAAWVDTRHVDPAAVASAMELAWSPFTSCRARVLSVLGSGASCQIVDA